MGRSLVLALGMVGLAGLAACRERSAAPQALAQAPPALSSRLDALVRGYHDTGRFNGVALVAVGGRVVLSKGYGWADAERRVPVGPDTLFRIGSITKTFTAVLVLELVEEGKLTLDSPVVDLLPYYRKDTGRRVTLRHLLSHTCGLPNYLARDGFVEGASGKHLPTREFVEKYCMEDLEFEPGSKQKYTNTGFVLLGAIVEELTHRPFQEALQERVLVPAGLRSTVWGQRTPFPGRLACSYERTAEGLLSAANPMDPGLLGAAGALSSTAEDLYRWDRALASGGLLSAEMKGRMWTPVMGHYALGWNVKTMPLGPDCRLRTLIGHDGGISGHLTHFLSVPDDGNLVVLLSNAWDNGFRPLSQEILGILYGSPQGDNAGG